MGLRQRRPELMDDPALDEQRHRAALAGLARLNHASGAARLLGPAIFALQRQLGRRLLRVLDVASGAGDIALALWRHARREGLDLEILGLDRSGCAIAFARAPASAYEAP